MKFKLLYLMMFGFSAFLASAQGGLSVEPHTNIKVLTGTTLKVAGGDLLLKSDATGDATVIAFGAVTHGDGGKAIVQRYLPGQANYWHMISAPVNSMAIAGTAWAPETDEGLFLWDEPDPGYWVNYKNTTEPPIFSVVNPGDNFVTGRGYIVNYNTANPTNNFESDGLNTGNINITLEKSAAKSWEWNAGLNMIGNPYASGLDWSAVSKSGIVSENFAQVYDPNKTGGAGYEPVDGTIASGQGFFVQAVTDEAVIALEPAQQVHTSTPVFMKQSTDKLVLRLSSETYYDETKISLDEASIPEHDFYDASKYFSFDPQVPQLYTLAADGWKLAINSTKEISETTVIPLSIKVQGSSIMTIQLTETEGTFEGQEIILHDLLTNTLHKFSENPGYDFMANADDNPDRFLLKFGVTGLDESPGRIDLNAWMQYNVLYILNPDAKEARVNLINIHGQEVLQKEIGPGLHSMPVNVATGIYLVTMRTENAVAMKKLFIR